jgi:membrane associated rhomboid family serine protease
MQSVVVEAVLAATFLAALLASVLAIRAVDSTLDRLLARLRSRFIYGVPWGTLVVVVLVLTVYLFVQSGYGHWNQPVTIPFRAWSYLYPTGMLAAGFAHNGPSHLLGNLTGTVVLGPLAEYVWGHYPVCRRVRDDRSLGAFPFDGVVPAGLAGHGLLGRPWIRAVVIFPGIVVLVAVAMSLFALGPVIGFSGTVFAFGGLALTRYPLTTLVALLLQSVLGRLYEALTAPIVRAGISGSPPTPPGWATIAIQGHALGLVTGVVLGLALLRFRNERPPAARLWLAVFVFSMTRGLWAVYWLAGDGQYVLFQALGVALVAMLALLIVAAATAPTRPWFPDADDEAIAAISWRSLSLLALLVGLTFLSVPAAIPNLGVVGDDPVPGDQSVKVADYEVTYGEGVRNRLIPAIDLPGLDGATNQTTSGVIVVSKQRDIWTQAVPTQRLLATGSERIQLGGVGWRETVTAGTERWTVVGNRSVYTVWLQPESAQNRTAVFASPPSTVGQQIDNRTVALVPERGGVGLRIERDNETLGRASLPEPNQTVRRAGLTFALDTSDSRPTLIALRGGTRVRLAARQT